jgi:hypothetical protein
MHKKVSNQWLYLVIGIVCIIVGSSILTDIKHDPKRGAVRIMVEIVPFAVMLLFGIFQTVNSVIRLFKKDDKKPQGVLGKTTRVLGVFTLLGIALVLFWIIIMVGLFILAFHP